MRTTIFASVLIIAGQLSAATPEQSPRQIIPAVAHIGGLDGSVWQSDVVIFNPTEETATVFAQPMSVPDSIGVVRPIQCDIRPHATTYLYNVGDLGSTDDPAESVWLLLESTADGGVPLPFVAASRTYNRGSFETFGQGIPAVAWSRDGDLDEAERRIVGLESSAAFRSNLGIVNPTGLEETFLVRILDASGAEAARTYVRLEPETRVQLNDILGDLDLEGAGYSAVIQLTSWSDTGEKPDFVVYGSLIDRRTNDPTYLAELPGTTQAGLPKHRVIPAVANTAGNDGSVWRSDVQVHSARGEGWNPVLIELVPTGATGLGGGSPESLVTTIRGGETKSLDDILGASFPGHEVAALVVQGFSGGGVPPDLRVSSRTWTPDEGGEGTMGQGIPGIPRREVADPVAIPGLMRSVNFRSNIGFVNPSTNVSVRLEVEIFDGGGASVGVVDVDLEPWSHFQINSILEQVAAEEWMFHTAVVSLVESENLMLSPSDSWEPVFVAYGSLIDRRTNDPSYIEGVRLTPAPARGQGDWVDFNADEPWYRCPSEEIPDEATVVRAFDRAGHWFGSENHRSVVREVDFPPAGDWNQVGLRLELECPESGLCDHWDRTGSLQLVLNPDDPEEDWEYLEIMRHITPYRVGMCEFVDVTPLAPLLTGRRTLVSWIDTWVGPGHSDGEGWRITWDFVFYPGEDRTPDDVVNIWGRRSIEVGNLDDGRTVDAQTEPVDVDIPADATRVEARLVSTGHSFGNALNCAEFCVMRQDLYIDGARRSVVPWRTDCEHNPVANQQGTWTYDRNGWCPGAITIGDTVDITDLVTPGETATLDFDIRLADGSEYENTNPGGGLTPIEWVSLQVYIYRD